MILREPVLEHFAQISDDYYYLEEARTTYSEEAKQGLL